MVTIFGTPANALKAKMNLEARFRNRLEASEPKLIEAPISGKYIVPSFWLQEGWRYTVKITKSFSRFSDFYAYEVGSKEREDLLNRMNSAKNHTGADVASFDGDNFRQTSGFVVFNKGGKWWRGHIMHPIDSENVQVMSIDNGVEVPLAKSAIHNMREPYTKIESAMMRCSLDDEGLQALGDDKCIQKFQAIIRSSDYKIKIVADGSGNHYNIVPVKIFLSKGAEWKDVREVIASEIARDVSWNEMKSDLKASGATR